MTGELLDGGKVAPSSAPAPFSIVIVGACGGCGSSVLAAAIADALVTRDNRECTLIDLAPPYASGLHATAPRDAQYPTSIEAVELVSGWRPSGAHLLRMDCDIAQVRGNFWARQNVPARDEWLHRSHPTVVVDFSWRVVETVVARAQLADWLSLADAVVLTVPGSAPGTESAELVAAGLHALGAPVPLIAIPRERRIPPIVAGAAGAYLSRAMDAGLFVIGEYPDVRRNGAAAQFPTSMNASIHSLVTATIPSLKEKN